MIPFKDDVGLARTPVITIALIVANVVAYILAAVHGGSLIGGPSGRTIVDYGAIPYEFSHWGQHCGARARWLRPGGAVQRPARRDRPCRAAAGDLGDRVHGDVPARKRPPRST
jgi:hypothetical protein